MQISACGLSLLRELEGSRPMPYQDSMGIWTLGIGHRLTQSELHSGKIGLSTYGLVEYGRTPWPDAWIDCLMRDDLRPVETAMRRYIKVPLRQHEYDALCCWIFNIGLEAFAGSTLLKRLNLYHTEDVPAQLRRWIYAGGQILPGLKHRREREIALWSTLPA